MSNYGRPPPRIEGMVSLKVDNLTYRTTPDDLRRVFERCGEVGDIYIPRDRFTRESRGFAFVRFYDKRDAEDALDAMDGRMLDGRELRVQMARYGRPPTNQYRNRGGRDRDRRYRSYSRSRSRERRYTRSRSYSSRSRSASKDRDRSPRDRSPRDRSPRGDRSPRDRSPRADRSPRDRSPRADRSPRKERSKSIENDRPDSAERNGKSESRSRSRS